MSAGAIAFGTIASSGTAHAATRSTIASSRPVWARAANRVGGVDAGTDIVVRVYLKLRDRAGLDAVAASVSDPRSRQYHHFLTTAQVRDRYAPSDASVASVRSWLAASGLRLLGQPANNLYVEAAGPATRVARAFGVTLSAYRVHGLTLRAADRDLSVPPAVAPAVAGVIGVDEAQALLRPDHIVSDADPRRPAPPPAGFRNAGPCSAYWGENVDTSDPAYGGGFASPLPYAPCGYTPAQLRTAYGLSSTVDGGHDGSSATVAIVDAYASPTIFSDASTYAARNDSAHPLLPSQFSQIVAKPNTKLQGPKKCDASSWYGEETLDVEAVHAIAPGAHILYLGSSDCNDPALDTSLNNIVANHLSSIVSNSWGSQGEDLPADQIVSFDEIAVLAAAEGIGMYFASGDDGDEVANLNQPEPDFPPSDPWVTAVGGTSLGIDQNGGVALETGWETGKSDLAGGTYTPAEPGAFLYGSGGGTSARFDEPAYQQGVVPDSLALASGGPASRVVPDIAMLGDPNTGMLVGQTQKFKGEGKPHYDEYSIGGTSLSSPLFAGVMALADDVAGTPHGLVNPSLYGQVRVANGERDIEHANGAVVRVDYRNGINAKKGTSVSVRTFDFGGLAIATTKGYDTTTGLGVPAGLAFLEHV